MLFSLLSHSLSYSFFIIFYSFRSHVVYECVVFFCIRDSYSYFSHLLLAGWGQFVCALHEQPNVMRNRIKQQKLNHPPLNNSQQQYHKRQNDIKRKQISLHCDDNNKNHIATVTTVTETVATFHLFGLSVKSVFFSTTPLTFSFFFLFCFSGYAFVRFLVFILTLLFLQYIFFFFLVSFSLPFSSSGNGFVTSNFIVNDILGQDGFQIEIHIYVSHSKHINQIVLALLSQCAMIFGQNQIKTTGKQPYHFSANKMCVRFYLLECELGFFSFSLIFCCQLLCQLFLSWFLCQTLVGRKD